MLRGGERSDTVFLEQPCLYLSGQQQIIDLYKPQKEMYCYYAIEEKSVDTTSTKDILIDYYKKNENAYRSLFETIQLCFSKNDLKGICDCSTKSSLLSQEIMPKKYFWDLYLSLQNVKADGIIVAHTGSLVGFLFCKKPSKEINIKVSSLF